MWRRLNWALGMLCLVSLGFAVQALPVAAQAQCTGKDWEACASDSHCMLDLTATGQGYQCRPAADRCEIGYRQHLTREEVAQDNAQARCIARPSCGFVAAAPCYCPKVPGILCPCDGGRPHLCQDMAEGDIAPPDGRFEIVTLRAASGVSSPPMLDQFAQAIGQSVLLSPSGLEMAGMGCDAWEIARAELVPRPGEADLKDVFIDPVPVAHSDGDKRILQSWRYTCEGTDTFIVTQVDARVVLLHLANMAVHAIAELPLSTQEVVRIQQQMTSVKYYSGPIDGQLNDDMVRAASFWAESRMDRADPIRYARPAFTLNLFDTMNVFE